jgi:toxin ParE1/3/4
MKIIWSLRAISRLESIHAYISKDAPITADKIIRRIIVSTERLKSFPNSGRVVPEYKIKEIREIIHPPYRILYHIESERIEIVNVLHSRQLLE